MSHKTISFIKSAVRVGGYTVGYWSACFMVQPSAYFLKGAFVILILSEFIGVYEEAGEK